jgi:acetyl/propionyl-CoA carboxylase alpha subunit
MFNPTVIHNPRNTQSRGEIATRVISTARELQITTYAIFTPGDDSHALNADHAIELPSASTFLDVDALINLTKSHDLDAVHPGYGFLSESDVFARRMWQEAGVVVVGPGWDILENTGDKLKARELAERCKSTNTPVVISSHGMD